MNRSIEAAVIENSADVILGEGLPYDRCKVGVVTRVVPEKHFGRYYIESPEHVLKVMRTQVDVVLRDGAAVLDAADPMAEELASFCDGEVIYVSIDPALPAIQSHLAGGGRAVSIRDGQIVLLTPSGETAVAPLTYIPFSQNPDESARLCSVLAAVAAAWALEIALHVIHTGVETFYMATPRSVPPATTGGDAATSVIDPA